MTIGLPSPGANALFGNNNGLFGKMNDEMVKMVGLNRDKPPMFKRGEGRVLSRHAVMYILKGRGQFEDTVTPRTELKPGSVFFLHPGRWHNFDPAPGTRWTEYWALFDGAAAVECFGELIPEGAVHQLGISAPLREAFEELHGVWLGGSKHYRELSRYLLHRVLMEIHLKANHIGVPAPDDHVGRARQAMGAAALAGGDFDLQSFAERENVGFEKLRKDFKTETGFPPVAYFIMVKLNRAKELLLRPQLTVKDIAVSLGIGDPYYFSRLFKKKEGLSPEAYRGKYCPPS